MAISIVFMVFSVILSGALMYLAPIILFLGTWNEIATSKSEFAGQLIGTSIFFIMLMILILAILNVICYYTIKRYNINKNSVTYMQPQNQHYYPPQGAPTAYPPQYQNYPPYQFPQEPPKTEIRTTNNNKP